jgi:SAM-dependent MidA family methyltransferase
MSAALYGDAGFFVRTGVSPDQHFRTSAHASPLFATAILRLVAAVDEALERPDPVDLVDVGAGTGDLLRRVALLAPTYLKRRLRLRAVELAQAPSDLPGTIEWQEHLPAPGTVTGVLLSTEWLDNVPLDVAEVDDSGHLRYLLVDPATGAESSGAEVTAADARWAAEWWPDRAAGVRIEVGTSRDEAWTEAVTSVTRGLAMTVDYGHLRSRRPVAGTLTGFQYGRETAPIPDGTRDVTAHVAVDAVRAAGERAARRRALLTTQHQALRALGLNAERPQRSLAAEDPTGYVRALSAATQAAELLDPAGLGAHYWLLQPVQLASAALPAGLRP